MTFGENLQFLRKRRGMTQEDLAEKMEVSRQSVSKWESNSAYPEMDAILRLCDLFSCDMDTLLRGDVSRRFGEDSAAYDQHMNRFSAAIAAGVGLILGGITLMMFLVALGIAEGLATAVFFVPLIAAVVVFIVAGMNHDTFLRRHPNAGPRYTPEEMERFERRFPILIAVPVALILLGVLATTAIVSFSAPIYGAIFHTDAVSLSQLEYIEAFAAALFLLFITIAVTTLVWAGIQHSKYGFPEEPQTPAERRSGRIWGFGMLAATAVYVGLGLAESLWNQAWPVYPVAALLCAAVTVLLKKDDE